MSILSLCIYHDFIVHHYYLSGYGVLLIKENKRMVMGMCVSTFDLVKAVYNGVNRCPRGYQNDMCYLILRDD